MTNKTQRILDDWTKLWAVYEWKEIINHTWATHYNDISLKYNEWYLYELSINDILYSTESNFFQVMFLRYYCPNCMMTSKEKYCKYEFYEEEGDEDCYCNWKTEWKPTDYWKDVKAACVLSHNPINYLYNELYWDNV